MSAIGFKYKPSEKARSIGGGQEVCACLSSETHDAAVSYGINPQGGGMNPFDEKLGETQSVCHQGGVMQVQCYDPYNNASGDATPTVRSNAGVSTAGPLAYGADLSQMRYIVRRLTPTEVERLMGLPDGYTIPRGLRITDELVAEFQRIHDTFNTIMYEYALASYERNHREGKPPPKPKSASQVRAWLEKITDPDTCPDSPRYKACGNGWATNQPRWILTRLLAIGEGIDPWADEDESISISRGCAETPRGVGVLGKRLFPPTTPWR